MVRTAHKPHVVLRSKVAQPPRDKYFDYFPARDAMSLNVHSRLRIYISRGAEDTGRNAEWKRFAECATKRGLIILDQPIIPALSPPSLIYILTSLRLNDKEEMVPGFRYESYRSVVAIVREGEVQAAAFAAVKCKAPPGGLPVDAEVMEHMFQLRPALQTAYNTFKSKWGGPKLPLVLTSTNRLSLVSHRALGRHPAPAPSDVSMPTLVRSIPPPTESMATAMPDIDERGRRYLLRLGRAEARRMAQIDAVMENGGAYCGACLGKGYVEAPLAHPAAAPAIAVAAPVVAVAAPVIAVPPRTQRAHSV